MSIPLPGKNRRKKRGRHDLPRMELSYLSYSSRNAISGIVAMDSSVDINTLLDARVLLPP